MLTISFISNTSNYAIFSSMINIEGNACCMFIATIYLHSDLDSVLSIPQGDKALQSTCVLLPIIRSSKTRFSSQLMSSLDQCHASLFNIFVYYKFELNDPHIVEMFQ